MQFSPPPPFRLLDTNIPLKYPIVEEHQAKFAPKCDTKIRPIFKPTQSNRPKMAMYVLIFTF